MGKSVFGCSPIGKFLCSLQGLPDRDDDEECLDGEQKSIENFFNVPYFIINFLDSVLTESFLKLPNCVTAFFLYFSNPAETYFVSLSIRRPLE